MSQEPEKDGIPLDLLLEKCTIKLGEALVTVAAWEVKGEVYVAEIKSLQGRVSELEQRLEDSARRIEDGG